MKINFFFFYSSWKRDGNGSIVYRRLNSSDRTKPVLEFVSIQRRDTKQWALPGVSFPKEYNISSFLINYLLLFFQ